MGVKRQMAERSEEEERKYKPQEMHGQPLCVESG